MGVGWGGGGVKVGGNLAVSQLNPTSEESGTVAHIKTSPEIEFPEMQRIVYVYALMEDM
jgi:hypothetical protein